MVDAIQAARRRRPAHRRGADRGARRSALPDRVPRHDRRAGGSVHDRRRHAWRARQARAPPSARVRRRRGQRRRRRRGRRGAVELGDDQARREAAHVGVRRRPDGAAGAGVRGHGAEQGRQGRVRLAGRLEARCPKIAEEADELARRRGRRLRRTTRSPTSSATCCSRSSTSPVTSTSIRRSRCGPRPTSSGHASSRWSSSPPHAASTCTPPTSTRSTRCGTRSKATVSDHGSPTCDTDAVTRCRHRRDERGADDACASSDSPKRWRSW